MKSKKPRVLYAIVDTKDVFLRETTWHYDYARKLNKDNLKSGRIDSRIVKFIEAKEGKK